MIFNLVKNETGLGELHKLTETFFGQLATASYFDQIEFPDWYISVFGATQLNDRFKDVFDAYKGDGGRTEEDTDCCAGYQ